MGSRGSGPFSSRVSTRDVSTSKTSGLHALGFLILSAYRVQLPATTYPVPSPVTNTLYPTFNMSNDSFYNEIEEVDFLSEIEEVNSSSEIEETTDEFPSSDDPLDELAAAFADFADELERERSYYEEEEEEDDDDYDDDDVKTLDITGSNFIFTTRSASGDPQVRVFVSDNFPPFNGVVTSVLRIGPDGSITHFPKP